MSGDGCKRDQYSTCVVDQLDSTKFDERCQIVPKRRIIKKYYDYSIDFTRVSYKVKRFFDILQRHTMKIAFNIQDLIAFTAFCEST